MLITTLLLKNIIKISLVCMALWACNLIEKTNKLFDSGRSWQDLSCDTAQTVNELSVQDIAQAFYFSDTLTKQKIFPHNVFIAIADIQGNLKMAGVTAQGDEHPQAINGSSDSSSLVLTWQEQEYMWALVSQPKYLFNRWEKLLADERISFLLKRDSIHQVMRNVNGSVKIISDLRSMANQQKYLGSNKTASPISMHNFGLAADFAVIRNNRMSNNLSYYRPLDNLTAKFGITWGGNFIGFLDPGHIQLFRNGAEMLRKYPDLIFEFEPYRPQYNSWMNKMINWGKEEKANDTKELLLELNKHKKEKPCPCLSATENTPFTLILKAQNQSEILGYQPDKDLLLVGDLASKTVSLITGNGVITYPLGRWK